MGPGCASRLSGVDVGRLFHGGVLIRERLKQVFETEKEFQLSSYELITPTMQGRTAEIVLTPLSNGSGAPKHALITMLESTRFNSAREREREIERLLKQLLLHSHPMPLTLVQFNLQLTN